MGDRGTVRSTLGVSTVVNNCVARDEARLAAAAVVSPATLERLRAMVPPAPSDEDTEERPVYRIDALRLESNPFLREDVIALRIPRLGAADEWQFFKIGERAR